MGQNFKIFLGLPLFHIWQQLILYWLRGRAGQVHKTAIMIYDVHRAGQFQVKRKKVKKHSNAATHCGQSGKLPRRARLPAGRGGGGPSWCRGPPAGPCECRCCGPPARSLGVAGWSWSWSGILAAAQPGLEMEKEIFFAALLK